VVTRPRFDFDRQQVVVANDESAAVPFIIDTLRHDGHRVTRADDASLEIFELAFRDCHLLICGTGLAGARAIRLFDDLHERVPGLPILCVTAATGWTPQQEARLPANVTLLREPLTAEVLRAAVRQLLPGLSTGTTLAWRAEPGYGPRAPRVANSD
jgi:DNA-binding NtrC family response regulator